MNHAILWSAWGVALAALITWMIWQLSPGKGQPGNPAIPASFRSVQGWTILVAFSVLWWLAAGNWDQSRVTSLANLSFFSFATGAIVGFLFSSYGEEQASLGKIRDWLVGGLTGITIAEFMERGNLVRVLLQQFLPLRSDLGLAIGTFVLYATVGCIAMFLNRELVWNPLLAKQRGVRRQLEELGTLTEEHVQAAGGQNVFFSPADQSDELKRPEELRAPAVEKYLATGGAAVAAGETLSTAQLMTLGDTHYLRKEYGKARQYYAQALQRTPDDAIVTMKVAQALWNEGQLQEAVQHLELARLGRNTPLDAYKLLGYYLLWFPHRLKDSVKYSEYYLQSKPEDQGARFNVACAFAQLYEFNKSAENRQTALDALRQVVAREPTWKAQAKTLTGDGGDFHSLENDAQFRELIS